jgi:hypothetical protein
MIFFHTYSGCGASDSLTVAKHMRIRMAIAKIYLNWFHYPLLLTTASVGAEYTPPIPSLRPVV